MSINNNLLEHNKKNGQKEQNVGIKQNEDEKDDSENYIRKTIHKINKNCFDKHENLNFGLTFLGRLFMTLYSFHGLFFIYNLIITYIVIIPGFLFEIENLFKKIFLSIIFVCFAFSCSNLLIIPTYEFLTFPYLRYSNPFSHLLSFAYIFKKESFDLKNIVSDFPFITLFISIIIGIMGVLYAISFLMSVAGFIQFKLYLKAIFLFINYFNYLSIVFCYFLLGIYLYCSIIVCKLTCDSCKIVKEDIEENNKCIKFRKILNYICIRLSRNYLYKINNYYKPIHQQAELPDINLVSYFIEPFLTDNYQNEEGNIPSINENSYYECFCFSNKDSCSNTWCYDKCCCQLCCSCKCCYCEDFCYNFGVIVKLILILVFFFVFLFKEIYDDDLESIIYFLILSFVMAALAIFSNFPNCYMNRKSFGCCKILNPDFKLIEEINVEDELEEKRKHVFKPKNPKMISIIRFISDVIIILVIVVLLGSFFILHETKEKDEKEDSIYSRIAKVIPNKNPIDRKKLLLPNICYSSIHNLPLNFYIPFINDAYYYFKDNTHENSSFFYENYKNLFFDDDYEIDVLGNLINDTQTVKMVQYNVINRKKNVEVTILAIKGTSYARDIYLDVQLYFSSVLLSLLSTFSIVTQKESFAYNIIEYSLSIPYRIFFRYLIVDTYLKKLKEAFIDNEYSFYQNVVIVGHSLGGGLAKLFGRMMKKQAISLSGPGVNAFHSLWDYEGHSENFEISAIDLVPDMDLVPRVEVSGGTIYRIICKLGIGKCHGKEPSLCEVLTMCKDSNYKEYCLNVAKLNEEQVEEIKESSELNN